MGFSNTARNLLIISSLLFIIIGVCSYFSGAMFVIMIWGYESFDISIIQPNFSNFPQSLFPTILHYLMLYLKGHVVFDQATRIKLFSSIFTPFFISFIIMWSARKQIIDWRPFKEKETVHGDAKWADEKTIRKANLRSKKGLLLGKDKKGFFVADGFQHCLLFAPTGSGKGVGFVIPNLLFWKDSVFIHDIKLENFELTSGWRSKIGQKVFLWNPASPEGITHCYNPLDWISEKPGQMVDDIQKISSLLMPKQDFWVNEARSFFVGIALMLCAYDSSEKQRTFGEIVRTIRSDDVAYELAVILDTMGKKIHPVAYMNIAAFLQKAEKERSGVTSTLNSSLELWANPLIDTATATSDFNIQTFKRVATTVYVGLTPDNLTRLRPLMQVFYQQATEFLSRNMPTAKDKYGVLFMMDEFPTLGQMEQFKTGIAYFRGYNVRLFIIVQDTEQLKGIYEDSGMNSFLSNTTYRITFAANNIETANLISQLVGNKTVQQESVNKPKFFDMNPSSRSLHVSEAQRALLLPQEVIMLPRDDQIILIESTSPIKTKKIKYYQESVFKKKLLKPSFVPVQEPYDINKARNKGKKNVDEQQDAAAQQKTDKISSE